MHPWVLTLTAYAAPLVYILLGLPLILGWVSPNSLYGFRIPAAFASTEAWYRINRIGGLYLVLSGVVCLVANVALLQWVLPRAEKSSALTIVVVNSLIVAVT